MATMREMLKAKIVDVVNAVNACVAREGYTDVQLRPGPPATDKEITDFEQHLGGKLPNSYREFLALHNGYEWLAYPGHMLSIPSMMPGGEWYDEILEWKQMCADYGSGEVLDGIVIANLGGENNWGYLDPDRPSGDDELTIVIDIGGDISEVSSLLELFDWSIKVTTF